jgi:hypothetical protein
MRAQANHEDSYAPAQALTEVCVRNERKMGITYGVIKSLDLVVRHKGRRLYSRSRLAANSEDA